MCLVHKKRKVIVDPARQANNNAAIRIFMEHCFSENVSQLEAKIKEVRCQLTKQQQYIVSFDRSGMYTYSCCACLGMELNNMHHLLMFVLLVIASNASAHDSLDAYMDNLSSSLKVNFVMWCVTGLL